jgi:hypothetical protein
MILLKKPYAPSALIGETKTFNVYGKSFIQIKNVYLQGIPYQFQQTLYNPFSAVPKLSANYPAFNAIKLDPSQYTSNNDNTVTFTMPSASRGGFVDIILENQAGYGALTRYAIKETYNPYTSGTPEYEAFQPYVRPWSQGVKIIDQTGSVYIITITNNPILKLGGDGFIKTIN